MAPQLQSSIRNVHPEKEKQQFVPFLLLLSIFDHRSFEIIVAREQKTGKEAAAVVDVQTKMQNAAQHRV